MGGPILNQQLVGEAFRPPARWPLALQTLARRVHTGRVRNHGVKDEDEDYDLPIWAGVVPLTLVPGVPIPDPRLLTGLEAPEYAVSYRRPTSST